MVLRVPVQDGAEGIRDIGDRIDIVKLAGGDDGGEECPVFSADLVTGEQSVFSCESHRPDGVLDRVGVEFEAAVFEEPGQAGPVIERIADIDGQPGGG